MIKPLKDAIAVIETLPEADQQAAAAVLLEFTADRRGVHELDADERAALEEALAELDRGEALSAEETEAFLRRPWG